MIHLHRMQLSPFPFALSSNFLTLPERVPIAPLAALLRDQFDARKPSREPAYHETYPEHFFHLFPTHTLPHQGRSFQPEFLLINDMQLIHWNRPPILAPVLKSSAQSEDRKSTRLNSSHISISYAVFCMR